MRMRNSWNRVVYRAWAPVYDRALERLFRRGRRRALQLLAPSAGARVLLPGVGTGLDLPLLPPGVSALGVDLSPNMLSKARAKLPLPGREIELRVGDVTRLSEATGSFDAAVLSLVLSVVPDPTACLSETLRVLRSGGRAVVFDKFSREDRRSSRLRRWANRLSTVLGTDIDRRFGDISRGLPCRVVRDEPSILRGMYRIIVLEKIVESE